MTPQDRLFFAVWGFILAQRAIELLVVRGNRRRLLAAGGIEAGKDGFGLIFAVHAGLLVLMPAEWFLADWPSIGLHSYGFLTVAIAATGLHYWAANSLGRFYTVRVIRMPTAPLVSGGPYRWLRHPIYVAVVIEVFAFPMALGLWFTGAVLGVVNLEALRRRIRLEERHLGLASA